jgi:DNA-binding response OmpR family regulator
VVVTVVLVVDDEPQIRRALRTSLEAHGYDVATVGTGEEGVVAAAEQAPDLVLLDLGLPDIDGYEVCRRLRARSDVPIIVVTARGDEVDRVVGLELGADDYLVKPFGIRELVARIRAVTRRSEGRVAVPDKRRLGPVLVDVRTRKVTVDGEEVVLTRKEFDLLALLTEEPGATRTRDEIMETVWDAHWYGPTKTLDVHVAALRRKLGHPELIETVRGVGFRTLDPD